MKAAGTRRSRLIENLDGIEAIGKSILVTEMERGSRINKFGLIEPDIESKMKHRPPRWCKVHSVGEDSIYSGELKNGDWVLLEFNRWTPRVELKDGTLVNRVDENCILLTSEDTPTDMHVTGNIEGGVRAPVISEFRYQTPVGTTAGKDRAIQQMQESKDMVENYNAVT